MASEYGTEGATDEVLGVLTGQVRVKSMPVAVGNRTHAVEDIRPDETEDDETSE